MSTMWLDDFESEAWDDSETDYDSEADYDSEEDYDSEARRSTRDRRARARRLVAQRRMEQARMARMAQRPTPMTARPMPATSRAAVSQTVRAIKNLDLETKVGDDSLRREIEILKRRMDRNGLFFALSRGVDQSLDSFGSRLADHEFVRAGIRLAPALVVAAPHRQRRGLEGYVLDPRVLSALAVGGVLVASRLDRRTTGVDSIQISVPTPVVRGNGQLLGVAVDSRGNVLKDTITWASQNSGVLSVASDGTFTAVAVGTALVTAAAGGVTRSVFVTVVSDTDAD